MAERRGHRECEGGSVDQRSLGLDLAVGQTAGDVGEDGRSKGHAGAATQRSEPLQLLIQREGHAEGPGGKRRRARNTGSPNTDERGKTVEERAAFLARPLDVRLNSPDDEIGLQVGPIWAPAIPPLRLKSTLVIEPGGATMEARSGY